MAEFAFEQDGDTGSKRFFSRMEAENELERLKKAQPDIDFSGIEIVEVPAGNAEPNKGIANETPESSGIPEKIIGAVDFAFPMQAGMRNRTIQDMKAVGAGNLASSIAGGLSGMGGLAGDLLGYITSPSAKLASLAPQAAIRAGNAATKSMPAIATYGKNIAQNTADAALFNNAARIAQGEEPEFGLSELAGGLTGGLLKSRGEISFKNHLETAKNYAARNNADVNFAERYTGKKGKSAVEDVIKGEIKPNESFDGAVNRLRGSLDALNNDFYKHLGNVQDLKIDMPPQEILKDLDDYVIKSTSHLGHDYTKKVSDNMNEIFENYMRTVQKNRLVSQGGITEREALNFVQDMDAERLYKEIGNLTFGELDYIKRGMQGRTSAWNRGAGTQERMGLESLTNKEGSNGILNNLRNQIEADNSLNPESKKAMIEKLQDKQIDLDADIDRKYLEALKDAGIISGTDIKRYMDLNKERSNTIGKLKIMERANDKYQLINNKRISISDDLNNLNEAGRNTLGSLTRGITSKAYDEAKERISGNKKPKRLSDLAPDSQGVKVHTTEGGLDARQIEMPKKRWNSLENLIRAKP